MAIRVDKTGRTPHREHWTKLVRKMMDTPAWRALSPKAQALYPWLKFEWHGPQFNNNGRIQFSCRQAAHALGIGVNAAMLAFRELQAKGFIAVTKQGSLGVNGQARGPSYEITELPLPGSEKPNGRRLFESWKEGKDFPVVQHAVNNPEGRNGSRTPSPKARQTHLQNGDVQGDPISKMKTPCLENSDVRPPSRKRTIIDLKTSLVTRPTACMAPPDLLTPVSPNDCELRRRMTA